MSRTLVRALVAALALVWIQAPHAATVTTSPVADARVDASAPRTNFGRTLKLNTDGSPVVRSYLKFVVPDLAGAPVVRATLRIYALSAQSTGWRARGTTSEWAETGITYANAPALTSSLGASGKVAAATWTQADVTAAVTGPGTVSIAIETTSTTNLALSSREAGANAPQLVVETRPPQPAPDTSPPSDPADLRTEGATETSVTLAWTASTDDVGVDRYDVFNVPSKVSSVPGTATSATVGGLACGTSYTLGVQAFDAAGNGSSVVQIVATTSACPPSDAPDPVVEAAGDIACAKPSTSTTTCQAAATGDILVADRPDAVLALGDNQYECGELANYQAVFDPAWGRVKALIRPVPGNHEYQTTGTSCGQTQAGAPGYYAYFGQAASPQEPGCTVACKGYYSYDLGSWHLVALNSNCGALGVGGCGAGSPQERWLRSDLAATSKACILAYWHHPRFSSGSHGDYPAMQALWQALYDAHADVLLAGHDHHYERFDRLGTSYDPITGDPVADPAGVREFVVGSGGRSHYAVTTADNASQVRNDATYGVLRLVLRPGSYDWEFRPVVGGTFTDSGTEACHP